MTDSALTPPARLSAALNRLAGATVTRVAAGGAVGSIIGLTFRRADAEWYIAVECSWRLSTSDGFVASSQSDAAPDGPLVAGVSRLTGASVRYATIAEPAYDLAIVFSTGFRLEVFADIVTAGICWYILGPDDLEASVEPAGTVTFA